jgi:hypothetical protein
MPRVAFKFTSTFGAALVDAAGRPGGEDSGGSLLRRLMRLVDDPVLVDESAAGWVPVRWGDLSYARAPLRLVPVNDTVLVNLDVVDSPELYVRLRRGSWRNRPLLVNVVWWNLSEWTDPVERRLLAVSFASFPTFCNSARTEAEVRDAIVAHCPAAGWTARLASENLGVTDPGVEPDLAARSVVYPAMWLFARKRPEMFGAIVSAVAAQARVPVRVRLAARELDRPVAKSWAAQPGWQVSRLAPAEQYRRELASATVFVATALDESYGVQYAELMLAGAVGLFPDRDWVDTLVPRSFPLRFDSVDKARQLLRAVLAQPDAARKLMVGPVAALRREHRPELFDDAFVKQLHEWSAAR